jgi:hypothetical protein
MEIAALLLSDRLPNDLVINEIYTRLCVVKSPLTPGLRKAIKHDTRMFNNISYGYLRLHGDYGSSEWMENDMFWILNDELPLMHGLNTVLKKEFGTMEGLVASRQISRRLWRLMSDVQKKKMYKNVLKQLARL